MNDAPWNPPVLTTSGWSLWSNPVHIDPGASAQLIFDPLVPTRILSIELDGVLGKIRVTGLLCGKRNLIGCDITTIQPGGSGEGLPAKLFTHEHVLNLPTLVPGLQLSAVVRNSGKMGRSIRMRVFAIESRP